MIRPSALLVVPLLLPLGLTAQDEPQLGKSELKTLKKSAAAWVKAEIAYDDAQSDRDRIRRQPAALKAREKFVKDLEKKSRKFDVLGSMADLREIFANTVPFDRVSTSGEPKVYEADPDDRRSQTHVVVAPKRYDPTVGVRTVVVVPSWDADAGAWERPTDYFGKTWEKSELRASSILAVPRIDASIELESAIPSDAPNAGELQIGRFNVVLGTVKGVKDTFNVDFDRVFLDVGKGSGGFALRFATYFPQFFAGLIIRDPVDVSDAVRFGSLKGMPVLLVSSGNNKDACDKLAETLNGLSEGACTVIQGKGDYPFTASQSEIDKWTEDKRRHLVPSHVICEPNHDMFNDAYWVKIGRAEPLARLAPNERPRLEVKADKEANRIDITARNVQDLTLMLNDDIVDLSKEFTVVINGVAKTEQRQRSLIDMFSWMVRRRDPSYLFTAEFKALVPTVDGGEK